MDLKFIALKLPIATLSAEMLKFITKKVIRRGSGSKKSDKSANDGPTGANVLFEFTDANVSKFSDLLEVAVRSKISNKSSEPLRIVEDEATDRLVSDFKNGFISKYQLESYSPSSLWSAAVQVLRDSKPVFEEDKCNTLRSANYDDVSQLARSLPQHSQKLIGVLCASAEMLIRADSASAPMVLNSLSNSIIWSLPLNSFVTTNALVNLIVDHRALFPSCHTFARKISTSFLPISPEEWRVLAKNSASIYAHQDQVAENASDSDADSQAKRGPKNNNNNSNNDYNNSSLGVPKPAGAGGDRLSLIAQGRGAGASSENSGVNNKSKPWRSTYTDELHLNDVNASASIDVSARLGLKPSAEPTFTKGSNNNNNNTVTTTAATTKPSIASHTATSSEGKLTLKDLQGVFSSSLVSAASLDFLRVNTVVADDYADTKTLSSTVKWILQAQELSDILLSASKSGVGANKGIISWAEFLLLADPFLRALDRNYMRAHKTKYNQPINVPNEEEETSSGGSGGSGGDSRESSSKATAGLKAEAKDAAGSLRSSLSQSQQKDNNRNNNSKLRSRGSFKSSSSSDEQEEEQDSDNDNTGYNKNTYNKHQSHQQQPAKNILTSSRDPGPTSRFASNKGSAASTSYRNNDDVADLEEVEEMELAEDPRRVSNNNNNSKGSNIRGSNSYKRSNSSDSEEEEETDRRNSSTTSTNNNSKGNRVSQFDNNINRRRQWEDPDVTDDNISITSGVKTAPVRRGSGNVNTSFGASALTRQTSQNKNSVFDLDLLDDSVASIPLMNDQSHSFEKPSNNNVNTHTKHSSALNKSVDRGMPMHNSFDDVSSSDGDHGRAIVVKQQRESPIEDGTDNANNNDRPLSSSFVSDSDEADSFKMPPRHTNTHFTAQAGASAGASVNRSHPSESANRSLLANSFDEDDEEQQYHSDGDEEKEGREGREQKHRKQPPLVGRSSSHIQQQQQQVQDVDQENEHDTEGGLDGAPPIKKKTGVKKFMKMFSLTSTSASSKSSVNNSQTSSVHGSPLRHRANSNESEHTVNSLNTSTLDNTTLNAAAPKSKSMFGRMKSSVSKPFKSGSTSSNKEGVSGSNKSDAGSETGSQISAADYAALHADRAERGRLGSIDSTDSAQINAHSALDDSSGGPSGKVKKNMLGRITSKMSKPFKSNSSNRSDAGSETGSQISGTENIAEQYRDQQRDTADSKKVAKDKASIATTTAAATATAPVTMAERDRIDSIDSESHLEGVPSGKVKKNMIGRITSKMSKPFKSSNSSNRSDAGSETGSQASAMEYAAILDERTSHSSGTATAAAGALGATERARGNSLDSTDSAHINNESHLEGVPSGKVKKNMLGRITSKMSKPFKSSNSSNRSDADSETGSQMSTADHAAVAADLAASGSAAASVPPTSARQYPTPTTSAPTSTAVPAIGAMAVASPPKPPKPVTSTAPAKTAFSAPAPAPAGPKYASYASALAHQPTDTSDRARASSFDSTDSAKNAHIEGLPSSSGAKDTDSAITKPKKSVLGRVASKMSKPFKAGTNKSESNKSDNGSEVGSQISEQDQQITTRAAPDRSALVSSQGSAPLTAAALNQRATSSDTAHASGTHSQLPLPRLERVSSLDSTSTHDQTGQPKLKKGMFGRITSKLSKPFKSGKSGTSSAGSAHDGEEMSETGSQISAEEHTPPTSSTAAPLVPPRTHLTSLKQPVSVMESVDLDSPVSGRAGSSGKYSIGIADSARDSNDHDAYSSSNTPDSVPIFTNTAASPTTIANTSSSRLPPTPRTVSRTHRAASDAASEEGSVNSAHTHETTSSTGSKKGKLTLKGMMHKSYKVVFQGNKKGSFHENAGDDASMTSTGAAPTTTAADVANSTTVEPPEKPAKLPFRFKKAGERQAVEEIADNNTGTSKPASPPKPVKPTVLSASHGSHPMPHVSHLNPVPQPTSPTIYSAEDIIAGTHSTAPASRPLPAVPTINANNDVSASQNDVITADRRLSNPALNKKRSSFSLGGLFGFGSSGSKENSRNSSRAPSRSNSFNGDADLTNVAAASGGNNNSGGNRESVNHRPHSTRDPSPQRSFNGTGLAALLRGQVPSPSPLRGRFLDRSVSTPMSPLTPTTPYMTQSYDTNYDPAVSNQEEQMALEMSNVLLESSRLASQNILDRVQAKQNKFTETHQHPHTVNVLADLQQIKQKRAKSQDHARVSSHHHRHFDDHNKIGSDLDDSDIEDQDGNTSVSSPAQRKLLLDWKSIVSRRAPQSVFLTSDSLAEMRQLVRTSRGDDVQVDLIALDDADEDAIHRQKRRMMSTVPDPLFGLSLHDKAALSHLRLSKVLKHSSNHSQNASFSLKPVNAADLTTAQLNKLVQENAFYSELDLAMGVKYSGQLSRVVSRFWRHRYFVLMVEPLINPNLFPQGGPKEESVPASAPLTPHSPFVRSSSLHIDTSAVENSNITDSTPSPLPGPVLVAPTDPTATASGPVPGKYQYFLLEYERCVSSRWGDVPVRLLKRYPAGDILALRTDTRAHKKGLEFTVILRRNTSTAPTSGTANESMKTTTGEGAVGKVSMQDFPSPVSRQPSAATGQSAKSTAGEEIEEKGFKSLVKKAKPGGRFAAVVKAEQKAQQAQQATNAAASEPSVPTTAPGSAQTPAPIVTEQEEPPVIETRWTRLLRRNSSKKENLVADIATSAAPTLPPPETAVAPLQQDVTFTGDSSADIAANDEEKQNEEEENASEDDKKADSDPEEEGEIGDNDSQADAATSVGGGSEFGDFYYRDGTLPPGVNEADLRSGKKINKKDFIKLKLKAPTPDERLQWVQIIHSIAAPTMYINTTSY